MIAQLLVLLAAASAAATVAVTARQVALTPRTGQALAAYRAPATAGTTEVDINSALGSGQAGLQPLRVRRGDAGGLRRARPPGHAVGPGRRRLGAGLYPGGRVPAGQDPQGAARHRGGAADLREPLGRHAAGDQLPACGGGRGDGDVAGGPAAAHLDGAAARRVVEPG